MFTPVYQQARFLISAAQKKQFPTDLGAEIAFVGRSNAGKSSALNVLTQQKKLARISKTPGRTQLINFFECSPDLRLVDLPGYGYAQVPQEIQKQWKNLISTYLNERQCLKGLILLMDIRHPFKENDQQLLDYCLAAGHRVHILLTKADKLSYSQAKNQLLRCQKTLKNQSIEASCQLFSALKKEGLTDLHALLYNWLQD